MGFSDIDLLLQSQIYQRYHAVSPPLSSSFSLSLFSTPNNFTSFHLCPSTPSSAPLPPPPPLLPIHTYLTHPFVFSINSPENKKPKSKSSSQQHSSRSTGSQLEAWKKTNEPHEEIAVGKKSSKKTADTIVWLDNMSRRAEGGTGGGR